MPRYGKLVARIALGSSSAVAVRWPWGIEGKASSLASHCLRISGLALFFSTYVFPSHPLPSCYPDFCSECPRVCIFVCICLSICLSVNLCVLCCPVCLSVCRPRVRTGPTRDCASEQIDTFHKSISKQSSRCENRTIYSKLCSVFFLSDTYIHVLLTAKVLL